MSAGIQHKVTIRDYNQAADTCTIDLCGIGSEDLWLDNVKISPAVNRAYLAAGGLAVVHMLDSHRVDDAIIIAIVPPTGVANTAVITKGSASVYSGTLTTVSASQGFGHTYGAPPAVSVTPNTPCAVTFGAITTTGFTVTFTGVPKGFTVYFSWQAQG